jgi:N-dimethylarginine dimethylaminohydrolase
LDLYHLDGCLGILPNGKAVLCPEVLSKTGKLDIERRLGRDNIIEISKEEAGKGATNFITVGDHVITPFASDRLKSWFKEQGFETVDPPSQGLKEGSWMFAKMGSVRCATLKLTTDRGFTPEVEKERVRESVMAL